MAILPSACRGDDAGSSAVRSRLSASQFSVVLCCLDLHKIPLLDMKDVQSENGHACVYREIHGALQCISTTLTDQQIVSCYFFNIFIFHTCD